ncbi:FtsX-like permease family protein [Cryobacterium gelidum]|uniref:FtsX-like permease family protein n=1 Tax=Cryobacterium gelidum TaxID=1259164 RepID=A0A4R9AWL5_9MICO|nr:FtsX-like permease family protein [Cryobacterium gelidum]TFD71291.1 FtsX-like permease family protein [Cryobacterium gelidum]
MSGQVTLGGFVQRDLFRNPRRTLTSLVGVVVGVGLFSAVLFFIDGSGASMTRRAVAPLTLDMQRVLTTPLGGGIRLEQTMADDALDAGDTTLVTLTIANDGFAPAHEVVVRVPPNVALEYVADSTDQNETPIVDVAGGSPLFQGEAGTGLNIGTVEPAVSVRITYRLRATASVASTADLPVRATISTREAVTPALANAPRATALQTLADTVADVPGVAAADPLVLVDMAAETLTARGIAVPGPVKLFAFDTRYLSHYPSVKIRSGSMRQGGALISAETARALSLSVGGTVTIELPGGAAPLSLDVTGITDLSGARPLFESREAGTLEKFRYVPFTVVVDPSVYSDQVEPAFEAAAAERDSALNSLPLEELDVLIERSILNSDPATAFAQTSGIAEAVQGVASGQDYLIDNISNTLHVAAEDAAVAKRLFVFLGLPGGILAAILTAYAGTLLAGAQRRENALLRVRGAARKHLLFLLALRTVAIAGVGSLLGTVLGFATVLALLGRSILFEASPAALLQSTLIGVSGGMLVTALALYVPGRSLITREIKQQLNISSQRTTPSWHRLPVDLIALAIAVALQLVALRLGAFDAPPGSVYAGQAVTLPLQLLVAPIIAWLAGTLFIAHLLQEITARAASGRGAQPFTRLRSGVLWRSITRRLTALTGGVVTVGLVVSLGTMLACFATVYDTAKVADARFQVGSDIRLTPNPTSDRPHPTALSAEFDVSGVAGATPVVFSSQNSVLTSDFNEDVTSLAAIDPDTFGTVAALPDSVFVSGTAGRMLSALRSTPDGILVNIALAEGLKLKIGDPVEVLLARDTDQQTRTPMRVVGLFTKFPGAAQGTDIVANLDFYQRETGLTDADYYLVASSDRSVPGLDRTVQGLSEVQALSAGQELQQNFEVLTSETALDRDQSSLTALNVRGLLQLDSFFTFLMAATATAMFVFGMLLQRRREYVTLRAQGMSSSDIRALVLAEAGISATLGTAIGVLVGIGMASQFVQVLRPIFTLSPALAVPKAELAVLAALVLCATALSSAAAAFQIGRLKPTELLRDE